MGFGISRGKEVAFGVAMQATSGGWANFSGEGGGGGEGGGSVFLICNNAGLKLYCKSYWVLQKIL